MGTGVGDVQPKSVALPAILTFHGDALRFDLAKVGVDLDAFPERMSWNRLWSWVTQIVRDPGSHLLSEMAGDRYVADAAERAQWATFEAWFNTQLPKGAGYHRIPRPWAGKRPIYAPQVETPVTPGREDRRAKLAAMF